MMQYHLAVNRVNGLHQINKETQKNYNIAFILNISTQIENVIFPKYT